MGIIDENFHNEGKTPELNDRLKILHSGKQIASAISLRMRDGIPSGPGPFFEHILPSPFEMSKGMKRIEFKSTFVFAGASREQKSTVGS
jgi:hypothetical protein